MASIRKEAAIAAPAEQVWEALRDWPAVHERLAPGFIVDSRTEGEDRVVTAFTGNVVRERIITVDDPQRRLVWTIVDGPYEHHNGSAQVIDEGEGRCRFVWIADVLPHSAAGPTDELMERGANVIKQTMEAGARAAA
jgi:uncharacterized protein YndB with AHSA1/START domain